jgi:MoaA/NifB/PqqE/SkfB family radical SAM enzyme
LLIGFALTQHCNLRCPHCIRDDVSTIRSVDVALVLRVLDDARHVLGNTEPIAASFTGGEPLLYPEWDTLIDALAERGISYRFVTNGWHLRRAIPSIDRWAPAAVRVSLSGATAEVHDAERGRDSFRRVLLAVALLTSRRVPTSLSLVVDRRDRHQLREAADLAEGLGCTALHYILPQPVPGSAARDSDLPPDEWLAVRREVTSLSVEPGRRTAIALDYGAPAEPGEAELECDTMRYRRVYVDARGRLSLCCQLSEYGFNDADVIADLTTTTFAEAWAAYAEAMPQLQRGTRPGTAPLDAFPCLRCARHLGKLGWLAAYPESPWHGVSTSLPILSERAHRSA